MLAELTISAEGNMMKKKRHKQNINKGNNPLVLAQRQAENENNSTRKTWADQRLLPIHDFDAVVPNPALSFPFTLDGFQQQAVARLERSESVFVAAHTSAGKTVGT